MPSRDPLFSSRSAWIYVQQGPLTERPLTNSWCGRTASIGILYHTSKVRQGIFTPVWVNETCPHQWYNDQACYTKDIKYEPVNEPTKPTFEHFKQVVVKYFKHWRLRIMSPLTIADTNNLRIWSVDCFGCFRCWDLSCLRDETKMLVYALGNINHAQRCFK